MKKIIEPNFSQKVVKHKNSRKYKLRTYVRMTKTYEGEEFF